MNDEDGPMAPIDIGLGDPLEQEIARREDADQAYADDLDRTAEVMHERWLDRIGGSR